MNRLHRWYGKSDHWRRMVENQALPWALDGIDWGEDVLQIGPGPGVTTDSLQYRAKHIEFLEIATRLLLPSNAGSQPRM